MLNLEKEYELSDEAKYRLQSFFDRYCSGPMVRNYGLGHFLYACHASFPLLLSADLANLIWLNFKNYQFLDSKTIASMDAVAVTDVLLSPLCRPIGHQRYELYPEIRSFLLSRLSDSSWFAQYGIKIDGRERLTDLALFLRQYLYLRISTNTPDAAGFRQINRWAADAWLSPRTMAKEIAEAFKRNADARNEHGQLWLSTQLDKLQLQYQWDLKSHADDENALSPFYRLYYYSQARKEQLTEAQTTTVHRYSLEIANFVETGAVDPGTPINLPLLQSAAERTERKIRHIQRLIFFGIASLPDVGDSVDLLREAVDRFQFQAGNREKLNIESVYLKGTQVNRGNISRSIAKAAPNEEDILFFFYSGRLIETQNLGYFEAYDDQGRLQFHFPLQEMLNTGARTVAVLVAPAGISYLPDPRNVLILASRQEQEDPAVTGYEPNMPFLQFLLDTILGVEKDLCYKDLFILLKRRAFSNPYTGEGALVLTTIANFSRAVLTGRLTETLHYYILFYDAGFESWRVVDEDFKWITLNGNAYVLDYSTEVPIPGVVGEVFVNRQDNLLRFNGNLDGLQREKFYKIQTQRHELDYVIMPAADFSGTAAVDNPPDEEIRAALNSLKPDVFSAWGNLREISPGDKDLDTLVKSSYYGLLVVTIKGAIGAIKYHLGYYSSSGSYFDWQVHTRQDLAPSVTKFIRYNYLHDLFSNQEFYVRYRDLDVFVSLTWRIGDNKSPMYIRDGKIYFYGLDIDIQNNEPFRVFIDLYLLTADLAIRKMTTGPITTVPSNSKLTLTQNDAALLRIMAAEDFQNNIKMLISRDPMQHDFSQSGIPETR
jgi:hypothetical protein